MFAPGSQHGHPGGLGLHASSEWDGKEHGGSPIAVFTGHEVDPQHSCSQVGILSAGAIDHKGHWGESSSRERTKDLVNNICHRASWVSTSSVSN